MSSDHRKDPGFAPSDSTDGRIEGEWETKYSDPKAKRAIRFEAWYLCILLVVTFIIMVLMLCEMPQNWLGLSNESLRNFNMCIGSLVAGIFGGTIFAIKWLYHTVAHNLWHSDRRLWRLFTPLLSGSLAFITIIIISSGLFGVFDPTAVDSLVFIIAVGFLAGYFSDNAAAKLAEIATSIFGTVKTRNGNK